MDSGSGKEQPSGYRGLIAWQRSMDFAESIYRLSAKFTIEERFGLTNQIRRACNSVPANIAEGRGKGSPADFARFLAISRGSLFEVETYLCLAERFGYVTSEEIEEFFNDSTEIGRLLSGLIRQQRSR